MYPQFFVEDLKIYQMLPRPYMRSFDGEPADQVLKQKWVLDKAKEILPSTCRIGETIFTSMAVIGGKLYRNHPKNLNHVHKDIKYLISVIITLGKDICGGDTVFYDGVKSYDFWSSAHILKKIHGRMVFGPFEKVFHEGTLWSGYRAVIFFILTKQIFLHLFHHGNHFYNRYLNSVDKKKYMVLGRNQNLPYKEEWEDSLVVIHYRQCLIEIGK